MKQTTAQGLLATLFVLVLPMLMFLLFVLAVVGWVMNLVAVVHAASSGAVTLAIWIKVAGIPLAPLGALLGWFA